MRRIRASHELMARAWPHMVRKTIPCWSLCWPEKQLLELMRSSALCLSALVFERCQLCSKGTLGPFHAVHAALAELPQQAALVEGQAERGRSSHRGSGPQAPNQPTGSTSSSGSAGSACGAKGQGEAKAESSAPVPCFGPPCFTETRPAPPQQGDGRRVREKREKERNERKSEAIRGAAQRAPYSFLHHLPTCMARPPAPCPALACRPPVLPAPPAPPRPTRIRRRCPKWSGCAPATRSRSRASWCRSSRPGAGRGERDSR